jgi:hypothetical protein
LDICTLDLIGLQEVQDESLLIFSSNIFTLLHVLHVSVAGISSPGRSMGMPIILDLEFPADFNCLRQCRIGLAAKLFPILFTFDVNVYVGTAL